MTREEDLKRIIRLHRQAIILKMKPNLIKIREAQAELREIEKHD